MRLTHTARATTASALVLAALTALPVPAQAAGRPEVDVYDTTVNESLLAPNASLAVRLDRKARSRVVVHWRTVNGTARAGSDFRAKSGRVVFAKGQRAKKIKISINDDDRREHTEFFRVAFSSQQARLARKRATVSIIDDDAGTYTGQLDITSRSEHESEGFYTLETWTLTMRPQLVASQQGTAWYDNGFGFWELTGSLVVEDRRPGAECRTLRKETVSGKGNLFTEPHPETDVTPLTGIVLLSAFFPQHAGNLGLEPQVTATVEGRTQGAEYVFDNGTCVPAPYEGERRFHIDRVPGDVVTDGRGPIVVLDHHAFEDNSGSEGLDTHQVDVTAELVPMAD